MQLKIKKQTEETITIETPKYYRTYYTNTIVKITDDGMIKVGKDILVFFNYNEGSHFVNEIVELLEKGTEVTEEVFLEQYQKGLLTLNNMIYGI